MQYLPKSPRCGRGGASQGSHRATAFRPLRGDPYHYAQLLCGRNLAHDSILTASGATMTQSCAAIEPFGGCRHLSGQWYSLSQGSRRSGDHVDQQLKQLMKELGEAINESLSDSEQIAEVVSRIKEGGYDIFLVLEATIGVSKQGEKPSDKTSLVTTLSTNPEFKINDQDLKFLKSLRIKVEEK
jgi:hypothetical protein